MNNTVWKKSIPVLFMCLVTSLDAEIESESDLLYRIHEVETRIEMIQEYNKESKFLPELLYNLSYMYYEADSFNKSTEVLLKLKGWERPSEVEEIMPGILYLLTLCFYHLDRFEDSINQADQWILLYEFIVDDNEKAEYSAEVYWFKGLSYMNLAEDQESIQISIEMFREAKECFEYISTNYQLTQFYQGIIDDINEAIEKCNKRVN